MRILGAVLGWFVGSVLRIRRSHAETCLARAGIARPSRVASAMYRSLGTNVFEFLWMTWRSDSELSEQVDVPAGEWLRVEEALSLGRGVVVATAHTGNWDLLACAMARRVPLTVVTKHLSWRSLDEFWQRSRSSKGVKLVDPPGAIRAAADTLRCNGVVAFLVDQAPERPGGWVVSKFLGAPARHDLSFAAVAMRHRAPVVVAFAERLSDGRHQARIPLVLLPPERPCRNWMREASLTTAAALERFIRDAPSQWLWLHRRWKQAPLAGVKRAQWDSDT